MKKLFATIILLAFIGFIAPKFIGSVVEKEHQGVVEKLNENPIITIKSNAYTNNWFGGTAVTEMTILLQDGELDEITIIIEEDLSFGPIIFTDEGVKFALSYSQANINFKDLFIDNEIENFIDNKIHITGLLTFSKDIISNIVIDEVSKEIDGNKVVSAKAVGQFTLANNNRLYGDFNWGGFEAITGDENFVISGVSFTLDQTLISGDYYQGNAISIGDFNFIVAAIKAKDAMNNEVLAINKLRVSAKSSVDNDLMKINFQYSADEMKSAGQSLKKANLHILLAGLDIKVMQEVNILFSNLTPNTDAMFNDENMKKISALVTKMLVNDPVLEVTDFSVETPDGKIETTMQISIDKTSFDEANLMSIMAAVDANADGTAPQEFFTKLGLAPMVDMYVEQGFILRKEQELSINVSFAQGKLQVNGQAIPL